MPGADVPKHSRAAILRLLKLSGIRFDCYAEKQSFDKMDSTHSSTGCNMFAIGMVPDSTLLAVSKPLVACYYLAAPLGWKRPSAIWGSAYRRLPLFATVCCLAILLAARYTHAPAMLATTLNVLMILLGLIALIIVAASKPLVCGYIYAAGLLSTFLLAIAIAFQHYQLALAVAGVNLLHVWIVWRTEKALQKRPR